MYKYLIFLIVCLCDDDSRCFVMIFLLEVHRAIRTVFFQWIESYLHFPCTHTHAHSHRSNYSNLQDVWNLGINHSLTDTLIPQTGNTYCQQLEYHYINIQWDLSRIIAKWFIHFLKEMFVKLILETNRH